jgi:hypothetical protein
MAGFVRQPLLKPEVEAELKKEMSSWWNNGYTAKQIADYLWFGKPGTRYEKLKPYHVYFYRQKFGFRRRRRAPFKKGTSRYKDKQEDVMSYQEFKAALDEKVPKNPSFHDRRKRTYLILHYWTPLRASEIYERTIDDFELKKAVLVIHLLRKKKHHKPSVKDEPLEVPLALPLMDEVVEWLLSRDWVVVPNLKKWKRKQRLNPHNRPWNISSWTAWHYVNEVFAGYYPHYFRFRWITDAAAKHAGAPELKAATGLHLATLNEYILAPKRLQAQIYDRLLSEEGVFH